MRLASNSDETPYENGYQAGLAHLMEGQDPDEDRYYRSPSKDETGRVRSWMV